MRYGFLIVMLALGALCVGCGGDDGGGEGDKGPTPVGTWKVDGEKYADAMLAAMGDAKGPTREQLIAGAGVVLTVKEDGTWTAVGKMGPRNIDESGTWKLEGDQLSIQWKLRSGKADDWTQTVTFAGDSFTVTPTPDMPFQLTMVRQ